MSEERVSLDKIYTPVITGVSVDKLLEEKDQQIKFMARLQSEFTEHLHDSVGPWDYMFRDEVLGGPQDYTQAPLSQQSGDRKLATTFNQTLRLPMVEFSSRTFTQSTVDYAKIEDAYKQIYNFALVQFMWPDCEHAPTAEWKYILVHTPAFVYYENALKECMRRIKEDPLCNAGLRVVPMYIFQPFPDTVKEGDFPALPEELLRGTEPTVDDAVWNASTQVLMSFLGPRSTEGDSISSPGQLYAERECYKISGFYSGTSDMGMSHAAHVQNQLALLFRGIDVYRMPVGEVFPSPSDPKARRWFETHTTTLDLTETEIKPAKKE